jgi:hypothetical protein
MTDDEIDAMHAKLYELELSSDPAAIIEIRAHIDAAEYERAVEMTEYAASQPSLTEAELDDLLSRVDAALESPADALQRQIQDDYFKALDSALDSRIVAAIEAAQKPPVTLESFMRICTLHGMLRRPGDFK